jgi:hypothetical protein
MKNVYLEQLLETCIFFIIQYYYNKSVKLCFYFYALHPVVYEYIDLGAFIPSHDMLFLLRIWHENHKTLKHD